MTNFSLVESKIHSSETIINTLNLWRSERKSIVFTNGCFDLLHLGHIDYLSRAADLGDILIIGMNSDSSVRNIKGETRPINDEISRSKILASFFFIDAVILFQEETPYELIKLVKPDVLVKGSDYKVEEIVGYDIVSKNGGQIKTIEYLDGYSTTNIEKRILNLNKK